MRRPRVAPEAPPTPRRSQSAERYTAGSAPEGCATGGHRAQGRPAAARPPAGRSAGERRRGRYRCCATLRIGPQLGFGSRTSDARGGCFVRRGTGSDMCGVPHQGGGRRSVAGRRGARGSNPGSAAAAPRTWCVVASRSGVPGPGRATLGVPAGAARPGAAGPRRGTGAHHDDRWERIASNDRICEHERDPGKARVRHIRKQGRPVMSQS